MSRRSILFLSGREAVSSLFSEYGDVISVWELAKMLKIGRNTTYELIRSGSIPSVRIGRQIRVSKQAVIEYLSRVSREKEI